VWDFLPSSASGWSLKALMDWKNYRGLGAEVLSGRSASLALLFGVVLLAYSAAHLTWLVLPNRLIGMGTDTLLPENLPIPMSQHDDALTMSSNIVSRHLFGEVQSGSGGPSAATIPETNLKLELHGVMASQDSRTATAIVADANGNENYYVVGEELPGGATLKEVHAQYIVLSRNGRFETLRLPTDSLKVSNGEVVSQGAETSAGIAPNAGELLEQYRDQFIRNPQSLANLLQGQPYWENGRLIGYRLQSGRDPALLEKFGIHSGDVVTAVNGVKLADPGGRMELLRSVNSATQLNVDLIRGGRPFSISIPVGRPG
jgi:general secretion pathway protein C